MVTFETWRQPMEADMRLRDFSDRTREGYDMAMMLLMRWACTVPGESHKSKSGGTCFTSKTCWIA